MSVVNSRWVLFCSILNQVMNKQPVTLLQTIPEKLMFYMKAAEIVY